MITRQCNCLPRFYIREFPHHLVLVNVTWTFPWGTKLQAGRSQFDSRWRHSIVLNVHKPCSRNIALELTQPLTEINVRKSFWKVKRLRLVRLTSPPSVRGLFIKCEIVGISTACYFRVIPVLLLKGPPASVVSKGCVCYSYLPTCCNFNFNFQLLSSPNWWWWLFGKEVGGL